MHNISSIDYPQKRSVGTNRTSLDPHPSPCSFRIIGFPLCTVRITSWSYELSKSYITGALQIHACHALFLLKFSSFWNFCPFEKSPRRV